MGNLLSYLAAGVVLLAAAVKYRSIRPGRPTAAQRHQLIMLVAIVPAHLLSMADTQAATAAIDPVPFTTVFLAHALAMVSGNSMVMMLAHALDDPVSLAIRRRRREATGVLGLALLAMAVLLVVSDAPFGGDPFETVAGHHPVLLAYYVVFVAFIMFCTGRLILLLRRLLSRPVEPLMRWGIRAVVVGAGIGMLLMVWTVFAVIDAGRLVTQDAWRIAGMFGAIAVLLMGVGSTLAVVAPKLPSQLRRRQVRRALRQLTPMWTRLVTTLPDVAFHQAELVDPEDVLYRRVIEVLDAQVRLSEHIPPAVHAVVLEGIEPDGADPLRAVRVDAALLAVAIEAHQAGCPPTASTVVADRANDAPDVLLEAHRLIAVDQAMRTDLLVARTVRAARAVLKAHTPLPVSAAGSWIAVAAVVPRATRWLASPWVRTLTFGCWLGYGWWVRTRGLDQ